MNPSTSDITADPESANFFLRLGLPEGYDLALAELRSAYFQLQQRHHPDRVPATEKVKTAQIAANLNDAYRVLKEPLLRARHLLHLHGIEVNGGKDNVKPGPELLMEVMEWHERIGEAGPALLEGLEKNLTIALEEIDMTLAVAFADQAWHKAAELTLRGHYLQKTHHELRIRRNAAAKEN